MNCELEFFWLFFTKEMLQEVVAHTSTYGHIQIAQKSSSYTNKEGSWTSTNIEEIDGWACYVNTMACALQIAVANG
jgi:hypothetical protein